MANIHITELSGLAAGVQNTDVLAASADAYITTQDVAIAASHAESNPTNAYTKWLRIVPGAICTIAVGPAASSPVAAVGGWILGIVGQEYYIRAGGNYVVSVIADTI